jgi:hypothetical protein
LINRFTSNAGIADLVYQLCSAINPVKSIPEGGGGGPGETRSDPLGDPGPIVRMLAKLLKKKGH